MMKLTLIITIVFQIAFGATTTNLTPAIEPIIGGVEVNIANFPWQLSLRYRGQHRCGASVLTEQWVITAAHCVINIDPKNLSFCAGTDRSSPNQKQCNYQADKVIIHPNYNANTSDSDAALVQISQPFSLDDPSIQAINLANNSPPVGSIVIVTGWGEIEEGGDLPPTLRGVAVQIIDQETCNEDFSEYGGVTPTMICAGVSGGGKDACQGDSGGPLIDLQRRLVGLVSWGIGCGEADYPGVYTRVSYVTIRRFIQEYTGL